MKTYADYKAETRDRAIQWQYEFAERTISWGELAEETAEWERLGRRYGLLTEFRENGIC